MNGWNGIGNLGRDPELRQTESGKPVLNLSLAVDDRIVKGTTEDRRTEKRTNWIPIVIWGTQAESCARYLQKGSKIAVEGALRTRIYQDQNGQNRSAFEVVADRVTFLGNIRSAEQAEAGQHNEAVVTTTETEAV